MILDKLNLSYLVYEPIFNRAGLIIDATIKDSCIALEKLIGIERQKLIGEKLTNIKDVRVPEIFNFLKEVILNPRAEIIERYLIKPRKRLRVITFPLAKNHWVLIVSEISHYVSSIPYDLTNKWHYAVNSINDIIFTCDSKGRLVQWNQALERYFKVPKRKRKPVYCYEVLHRTLNIPKNCPWFYAAKKDQPITQNIYLGKRWYKMTINPILDEQKNILGSIHILTDITKLKDKERSLLESEEKFRTLVEEAQYGVVLLLKDTIVYANQFISNLLGFSKKEDLLGQPYYKFIYPKERGLIRSRYRRRLKGLKVPAIYETLLYSKDKKPIPVELQPRIITLGGKKYNLVIIYDLSIRKELEGELKDREERYRTIFENVNIGLYRSLPQGVFVDVNPALVRILGYSSKEELLKVPVKDTYAHPQERQRFLKELKAKGFALEKEIVLKRKDGQLITARVIAHAHYDNRGRIKWIDGVVEDITQRLEDARMLKRRELILEANAFCAQELLKNPDWRKSIKIFLESIGKAAEVSRAYLWEKVQTPDGRMLVDQTYEWVDKGIKPQQDNPLVHNFDFLKYGFDSWYQKLKNGEVITTLVKTLPQPQREYLSSQDIKSICLVPILVENEPWGLVGFDQCDYEREWTQVEVDALKTFAGVIGSAIYNERVNNALKESEEKYRNLVKNLNVGVFRTSPEGHYLEANLALARIHGYKSEAELLKINASSFYENSEDRKKLFNILKEQGAINNWEVNQIRRDGKKIIVSITARASFDKEGNVTWIEGIVEDITERKRIEKALRESEERYRKIFETANDGIMLIDINGNVLDANQRALEIAQLSVDESWRGKHIKDLGILPSHELNKVLENMKARFSGKNIPPYEVEIITSKGERRVIEVNASIIYNEAGQPVADLAVLRDVTERKKFEEELKKAKEMAEFANKAKSEFLHNMSHEIRSPLTSIIGFAHLLLEKESDPEKREFLEIINHSSEYLLQIINHILDLARIESGKMPVESVTFDIRKEAQEIYNRYKLLAQNKGLKYELKLSPNLSGFIKTDRTKLEQIVSNLLDNAFKFTEKGKIVLYFGLKGKIKDAQATLLVYVKDTGIGISKDRQSMIFERFVQGEYYLSKKYGGAGLGLPLVKELVELLGGKISLQSELARGSKFIVELPVTIVKMS
jgi:PAS domain S-box-containing protein